MQDDIKFEPNEEWQAQEAWEKIVSTLEKLPMPVIVAVVMRYSVEIITSVGSREDQAIALKEWTDMLHQTHIKAQALKESEHDKQV